MEVNGGGGGGVIYIFFLLHKIKIVTIVHVSF